MKIVMTLLVRDEEDILAANIDYHVAMGVDHVIAMDNKSVDGTRDILRRYEARGVLTYMYQGRDDYSQADWVTEMARIASTKFAADWVINNDADEFWWPAAGNLRRELERVSAACDAVEAARLNFVPVEEPHVLPFFERMLVRERTSYNALNRPLPPKVCHRGFADIAIAQGNHAALRRGVPLVAATVGIEILHFPVRSQAQFVRKIANGGAAYSRNTVLNPGVGETWRRLYAKYLAGELPAIYRDMVPSSSVVSERLAGGSYVADARLRDFLHNLRQETARRGG